MLSVSTQVRVQFDALLLEQVLAPLQSSFGEMGDLVANEFATALARTMEAHRD